MGQFKVRLFTHKTGPLAPFASLDLEILKK
jgi:hypothetical protein